MLVKMSEHSPHLFDDEFDLFDDEFDQAKRPCY